MTTSGPFSSSQGPLDRYNSLQDPYLNRFYSSARHQKHLVKTGQVTEEGVILDDESYRSYLARLDREKDAKDLLAKTIFDRSRDLERRRKAEINRRVQEIAQLEVVQRVRRGTSRSGPILGRQGRARSSSLPTSSSFEELSYLQQADTHELHEVLSTPAGITRINDRRLSSIAHHQPSPYENAYPVRIYLQRPLEPAVAKWLSRPENRHLLSATPGAVKEQSDAYRRLQKSRAQRCGERLSKTSPLKAQSMHNLGATVKHRKTQVHSNVEVTFRYRGRPLKVQGPATSSAVEIEVVQQHCGGNTVTLFRGYVKPFQRFKIVSQRHIGMPFALCITIDRNASLRISTCCEYKHIIGKVLGSANGQIAVMAVKGGDPCSVCRPYSSSALHKDDDDEVEGNGAGDREPLEPLPRYGSPELAETSSDAKDSVTLPAGELSKEDSGQRSDTMSDKNGYRSGSEGSQRSDAASSKRLQRRSSRSSRSSRASRGSHRSSASDHSRTSGSSSSEDKTTSGSDHSDGYNDFSSDAEPPRQSAKSPASRKSSSGSDNASHTVSRSGSQHSLASQSPRNSPTVSPRPAKDIKATASDGEDKQSVGSHRSSASRRSSHSRQSSRSASDAKTPSASEDEEKEAPERKLVRRSSGSVTDSDKHSTSSKVSKTSSRSERGSDTSRRSSRGSMKKSPRDSLSDAKTTDNETDRTDRGSRSSIASKASRKSVSRSSRTSSKPSSRTSSKATSQSSQVKPQDKESGKADSVSQPRSGSDSEGPVFDEDKPAEPIAKPDNAAEPQTEGQTADGDVHTSDVEPDQTEKEVSPAQTDIQENGKEATSEPEAASKEPLKQPDSRPAAASGSIKHDEQDEDAAGMSEAVAAGMSEAVAAGTTDKEDDGAAEGKDQSSTRDETGPPPLPEVDAAPVASVDASAEPVASEAADDPEDNRSAQSMEEEERKPSSSHPQDEPVEQPESSAEKADPDLVADTTATAGDEADEKPAPPSESDERGKETEEREKEKDGGGAPPGDQPSSDAAEVRPASLSAYGTLGGDADPVFEPEPEALPKLQRSTSRSLSRSLSRSQSVQIEDISIGAQPAREQSQSDLIPLIADNEEVVLNDLELTEENVEQMAKGISSNPAMTSLTLRNVSLDSGRIAQLKPVLTKAAPSLKMINLNVNKITAESMDDVADVVKSASSLQMLTLRGNPIGDDGLKKLVDALVGSGSSTAAPAGAQTSKEAATDTAAGADKRDQALDDDGEVAASQDDETKASTPPAPERKQDEEGRPVADIQRSTNPLTPIAESDDQSSSEDRWTNAPLEILDLGDCGLTDSSAASVAQLISKSNTIADLNLSGNCFSPDGLAKISDALTQTETLTSLSLDYCGIGDTGVQALAAGLAKNKSLESLDLESTGLSDGAAEYLLDALLHNTTIDSINLSRNAITTECWQQIKRKLDSRTRRRSS